MIELFDASRLLPRRDHSLPLLGLVLAAAAGAIAVYAGSLQQQLRVEQASKQRLESELRRAQAQGSKAPSAALLADLQRQAEQAEAENAAASSATPRGEAALAPSAWLERLASLGSAELSLTKVDVDPRGSAHIEGLAVNAQAVSNFVQAFSRQEALAGLAPRSVELRHDKTSAPHLRFQMQATAPGGAPGLARVIVAPPTLATPAAPGVPTAPTPAVPTAATTAASAARS